MVTRNDGTLDDVRGVEWPSAAEFLISMQDGIMDEARLPCDECTLHSLKLFELVVLANVGVRLLKELFVVMQLVFEKRLS